jgi:transcriptional regulator with XRE-family HTH domain
MQIMDNFGVVIRKLREGNNMPLRKLAALLDIDQSTLSKIERNERKANKRLIKKLSRIFKVHEDELMVQFLSDKIYDELIGEDCKHEALKLAEQKLSYRA